MNDPTLAIHLFGGVRASRGDEQVDVGPPKCQTVLAALALSPGSSVPLGRLVELVWGTEPPASAERTLQSYIARLRSCLGSDVIARHGSSYCLEVPESSVDSARFEQHLNEGRVADALAEWKGPPLDGLNAPGLDPSVTALTERWLVAVEVDLESRIETDPAAAIGQLTELTARHPFREGIWALLMTALYRSGRQADALAAYRSAHEHLVEQLGLEPGHRLRDLEVMILSHDDRLGAVQHPPLRTERATRGNLPRRLGHLIGRDDLLTAVADALAAYPIVTLVGPGGIGKTQLALAAAQTAAYEETWVIELASIESGEHLPRAMADTLGIQDRPGETLTGAITLALEQRHALVVLDNCEHVIDDAAALAQTIIQDCPNIGLLATSRERLGLTNERVLTVTPLEPTTSAAELFNERATAITPGFDPDTTQSEVEEICARLDGIPLAIEIAAARTTSLTPAELLDRLDRHHSRRLLAGGPRTSSNRHQTLHAAIQWSYDLLTQPEQDLFQRLAAFTRTFDLAAAEAVATSQTLDAIEVDHLLGHLVDQSMLTIESGPFGRRFRFLEPIHDFATDRLEQSGHADHVASRHTRWCLTRVTNIGHQLAGWDEIDGVVQLDELWPELRTAVDRALVRHDRELVRRLVEPILGEIVLRSRHEIGDWLERLLETTPGDDHDARVFALYWAAHRYNLSQDPDGYQRLVDRYGEPDHPLMEHGRAFVTGDYEAQARTSHTAGLELRRQGNDHLAERTDINLATALLNLGRYDEQEAHTRDLVDRYRRQGPPTYLNWSLMLLGYNALLRGRPDQADAYFSDAIEIDVPPRTHSPNQTIEARRAHRNGQHDDAYRILHTYINDIRDTDNYQAGLLVCIEFINMMVATDRRDDALTILRHLETTGLLDNPAWRSLVADAAETLQPGGEDSATHDLDHREALDLMANTLDELTNTPDSG